MAISKSGQHDYKEQDGRGWTFMWQTLKRSWSIQQVLMAVRTNCVNATNATQTWLDTLHAIGETKMYSITTPRDKNVDEIAAHWIATLLEMDKLKYYRALIIVKARPSDSQSEIMFSCHAATRGELVRMIVKMEPRIKAEKPVPLWTIKDTTIDVLDSRAAAGQRAVDPAANLLHDCVVKLGAWDMFKLEGSDDTT